jgi:hypothetical protein
MFHAWQFDMRGNCVYVSREKPGSAFVPASAAEPVVHDRPIPRHELQLARFRFTVRHRDASGPRQGVDRVPRARIEREMRKWTAIVGLAGLKNK